MLNSRNQSQSCNMAVGDQEESIIQMANYIRKIITASSDKYHQQLPGQKSALSLCSGNMLMKFVCVDNTHYVSHVDPKAASSTMKH